MSSEWRVEKIRIWDKEEKRMLYFHDLINFTINHVMFICTGQDPRYVKMSPYHNETDCTGKKIFELDIVNVENENYIVPLGAHYDSYECQLNFVKSVSSGRNVTLSQIIKRKSEFGSLGNYTRVVGNQFENIDLLMLPSWFLKDKQHKKYKHVNRRKEIK